MIFAKTKTGEKYAEVELGCVPFTDSDAPLDERNTQALDAAAEYLMQLKNVVRVYLDLTIPPYADKALQKRYREQAFAIKNYLTQKGVFTHLQDTRKVQFPAPAQDKAEKPSASATSVEKPKAKSAPAKPAAKQPRDPSADYAYHVNKPQVQFPNRNPTLFQQAQPGPLQFVPLETIYFVYDKDKLTERAQGALDAIANYIGQQGNVERLILRGHADERGTQNYNYRLTDRRAAAVRDYLVQRGLSPSLIEVVSSGEMDPVDENWSRPGRARNRRVELFLVQRDINAAPMPVVDGADAVPAAP
jgi:outer membrane protein OmpA-like peptidoglycan-associated protein